MQVARLQELEEARQQAFQDAVKRAGSLEAMDEAKQVTRGYS